MNEIPENLKSALEKYAEQSELLANDGTIFDLNGVRDELMNQIADIDKEIEQVASQYTGELNELEEYITAQIMELGTSVNHAGVQAKHVSGYTRTTWQGKVVENILLNNPALIPTFKPARKETEVSPRVNIVYLGPLEESVQYSREDYEASKADTPF